MTVEDRETVVSGTRILPMRRDERSVRPSGVNVSTRSAVARAFEHVLRRVAYARMTGGNQVELLRDGPATYGSMLDLIDRARRQLDVESYIVRGDVVGRAFGDALIAAAGRDVHVRLLTDWIGSRGIPRRFMRELVRSGVDVCVFNGPSLRRPWRGTLPRDHRKLLVVDRKTGIVGGIGIGQEWSPDRRPVAARLGTSHRSVNQWRDTAVRIQGEAAEDMARSFERMWQRATATADAAAIAIAPPGAPCLRSTPALVGIVDGDPWRFRTARAFHLQTLTAERSIWIADAYFMPSMVEVEALVGAARDGVDVRLLVPSRNDHSWMLAITRRYYRRLLRGGVRIWEWPGPMMHAKTTVVDGHLTRVGSTDFNPLGLALNYELDAVIEDEAVGGAAETMFLDDLDTSREIVPTVGAML